MKRLLTVTLLVVGLAATPARAQTAGVARDGLSGGTLALHLVADLLAGMIVIGHGTMYGNMLLSDAPVRETLQSGMGAWPTITLAAVAGSAALAIGAVGLAGGDEQARTISIVSTTVGSLALACAALDLTLFLLTQEPQPVAPVAFHDGDTFFAGIAGRL
jgi:hypothetical protein